MTPGYSAIVPSSTTQRSYSVRLHNPPANTNTPPFTRINNHTGTFIQAMVNRLEFAQHANIGFSNVNTGESLAWITGLLPGQGIWMTTFSWPTMNIGVRASTNSTPGGESILTVSFDRAVFLR